MTKRYESTNEPPYCWEDISPLTPLKDVTYLGIMSPLKRIQRLEERRKHLYIYPFIRPEKGTQTLNSQWLIFCYCYSYSSHSNFSIRGYVAGTTPVTHFSSFHTLFLQGRVDIGWLHSGQAIWLTILSIISLALSIGKTTLQHLV